jgi:hypothetical protein
MAVSKSKIGIYSIAGILTAVLIVVSFVAAGVQFPSSIQQGNNQQGSDKPGVGTLIVSLKDAPVEMKKLMITVSALYIQGSTDGIEDTWKLLPFIEDQEEITFDLLQYKDISLEVAEIELNAGIYNKVRLEITSAIAIYENDQEVKLKVPPGHIDIIVKIEIETGAVTNLVLDIEPDAIAINRNNIFRPTIKAIVTTNTESMQVTSESIDPTVTNSPSPTETLTLNPNPT